MMRFGGQLSGTPSQAAPTPSTSPSQEGLGSDEIGEGGISQVPPPRQLPPPTWPCPQRVVISASKIS